MNLSDVFNPWNSVLADAEAGKSIKKAVILDLLASDTPVPEKAKPLLIGLFDGTYKFQRGTVSRHEEMKSSALFRYRMYLHALTAPTLENAVREFNRLQGDETPYDKSLRMVADECGVDPRTIQNWIKESGEE